MAHGVLNSQSCFITRYWSLKLGDYGLNGVLAELAHDDILKFGAPTVDGMMTSRRKHFRGDTLQN
jgi:hypothetical protein